MPDHVRFGEFTVERLVVVLGAVPDVEPIRVRRKEFRYLGSRQEVGQDGDRLAVVIATVW